MGARSGNNYLSALRRLKAALWLDGVRVEDPTVHPVFRPLARKIASLYDLQSENPGAMTYRLDDGDRIGYSFVHPANLEEKNKRAAMLRRWAELSVDSLRETPDTMNLVLTTMAAAPDLLSSPGLSENLQSYYQEARRRDWCIAGALPDTSGDLRMVSRDDTGIVVRGSQRLSLLGSLAEEFLLYPTMVTMPESALVFAISANTRGIELHCRTSPDAPQPLSECIATFDQVAIPASRLFLCGDIQRCTALIEQTGAAAILAEQQALKAEVAAQNRS